MFDYILIKFRKLIGFSWKFVVSPNVRFHMCADLGMFRYMSDRQYLSRLYKSIFGRNIDLDNPKTFNEKIQWLKLYDRKPEYTMIVDKYRVREYIARTIGEEYLIPLLGVWEDPEDIDFDALPDQFVLKCNHNSGLGMCICKDKSKLDIQKVKAELKKGLKQDYYLSGREWPYKDVLPCVIAEKFIQDKQGALNDYKLMCFNGDVKCSFVCSNRFSTKGLHVTFFDRNWNVLPFERHYPSIKEGLSEPVQYAKMLELAEKLALGIPFVRVDFYEVDGKIYFGELTFYPGSGFEEFTPEEWDYKLGEWLTLPEKQ